jgi:hypothetical protein
LSALKLIIWSLAARLTTIDQWLAMNARRFI